MDRAARWLAQSMLKAGMTEPTKTSLVLIAAILSGVLTQCSSAADPIETTDALRKVCGDGHCQGNENCRTCPSDCKCASDAGTTSDASVADTGTRVDTGTASDAAQDTQPGDTGVAVSCTKTVAVGASIQAAVDSTPDGGTVCLTAGATYTMNESLYLRGRANLTIDGKGATIRAATLYSTNQELIYVAGGSNLTFRNMTLVGTHPSPGTYLTDGREFQAGVALLGVSGALVEAVVVRNNLGDGFGVYGHLGVPSTDIVIRSSESHGNGRMGVAVVNAHRVLVEKMKMSDQAWVAFEVEPDANGTDSVSDVTFQDSLVYGSGMHLFAVSMVGGNSNITCQRNKVLAGPNRGIWSMIEPKDGSRNSNIVFRDNVGEQPFWEDPGWKAILLVKDTDGVTVTGNVQPVVSGTGMVGVLNDSSTGLMVSGNSFPGTTATVATR